jgi:hypothetical protein
VVTEQAGRRVLILDPARPVWDPAADPAAVLWSFSPEGDPRYADLVPEQSWTYVNEAKARRRHGRAFLLTTASFGFAAVVDVADGGRYWGTTLAPGTDTINPHSMELLPDGNVAVSSSTGDSVRLYAASQGPANSTYAEVTLEGAHGVQWDEGRGLLWALGTDELISLRTGGTRAAPTLRQISSIALPHPVGKRAGGHELNQVAGRSDRLWISTSSEVFQYAKSRRRFEQDFPGAAEISRGGVKCVSNDRATGQVLTTVPEAGLGETWWTTTASVHNPARSYKLVNGGIYKARWWAP